MRGRAFGIVNFGEGGGLKAVGRGKRMGKRGDDDVLGVDGVVGGGLCMQLK